MPEILTFTSPLYSNSVNSPSREQARDVLLHAYYASRKLAFDYAPLKHSAVIALAGKAGAVKSAGDLAKIASSVKAAQLENEFASMIEVAEKPVDAQGAEISTKKEKGSPVEFAFSLYFNSLVEKMLPVSAKLAPAKASEVRLVANFGGWMSVRKVSVEKAEKKEVVACCASVYESVRKKLPEFVCLPGKSDEFDSVANAFLSKYPERKSYARVPEVLSAAQAEESKISLLAEKGCERVLLDLFYSRCLAQVGFPPYVSIDQVSRIYPELKIPKPRGRIAGAKKK